ncbi:MAG: LLM class flavin-dependent oxidoreductase [Anaerolineales bacterium]|nr:LLM class flavin-dependent oxidoreductase [Anaerolineales bacterium]
MTLLKEQADFGWILPTGRQRMPAKSALYLSHVQDILDKIGNCFHSAWIPDHLMAGKTDLPESFVTLSYLAGQFPELFFGTIVTCQSFRNPALLAKMASTLQQMSAGRFVLGLGAGWNVEEYQAYGYVFPQASTRIAQMAETIQICKALWDPTQDESTFVGEYYQINQATCFPKPSLPPPLMVGGGGEKLTLQVVAQHADWWNLPGASLDDFARKTKILEGYCQEIGRSTSDIRKSWMGNVSIAHTKQEAEEKMMSYDSWPGDVALLGTPVEIWDQISAYIELGVDLFILRFVDEPEVSGIELFQSHVLG